jgi:hypothetical protein
MRDYTIKGYTWLADIYCYECGHTLPDIDPEGNDKHAVFSWDVAEFLDHNCGKCGGGIE